MTNLNNKQIEIEQTNTVQAEQITNNKSQLRGFDRRFMLYDRIKVSLKTIDIIIAVAAVLLFITFFLGVYKR